MLTTGIDINLPETTEGEAIEEERVVISLDAAGKLYINDDIIHPEIFAERIEKLAGLKREVFLRADERLQYGEVMKLMARLKKAGIENVALVTLPLEEDDNGQNGR